MSSAELEIPSISQHPEVQAVVTGRRFIESVRSYSILMKANSVSVSDDEIRSIALNHSYPRIALILASTKDKDGNPALGGIGATQDYSLQYIEVLRLLVSPPYRDDIHRIAAQLTAAQLIKQLPLNSSLQFFNLGVQLEEQAIKDLERIAGSVSISTPPETLAHTLYIAGSAPFSVAEAVAPNELIVPVGHIPYCWYYLTTTSDRGIINSSSDLIRFGPNTPLSDVVNTISLVVNEACINVDANILASPNRHSTKYTFDQGRSISYNLYGLTLASRGQRKYSSNDVLMLRFFCVSEDQVGLLDKTNYVDIASTLYIPSLLYGVEEAYSKLTMEGPHSLIVPSEKASDKEGAVNTSKYTSGAEGNLDTFYFSSKGPLEGSLRYRISASTLTQAIGEREVLARGSVQLLVVDFLEDLHALGWQGYIIGAIPYPDALHLVIHAALEDDQMQVVLDILEAPNNLLIALGSVLNRSTPYESGARSIALRPAHKATTQSQLSQLPTVIQPQVKVVNSRISVPMQAAFDARARRNQRSCREDDPNLPFSIRRLP